jgi:hypothetical protein
MLHDDVFALFPGWGFLLHCGTVSWPIATAAARPALTVARENVLGSPLVHDRIPNLRTCFGSDLAIHGLLIAIVWRALRASEFVPPWPSLL